ncbi:MAG: HNH endonuclease [Opitutae bacterium]|nr:HNH endonuclease [Opitutae bacterium]
MEALMSSQVLVLNRFWQAVNVVGIKRAFSLLVRGHADVIHREEGNFQLYDFDQWIGVSEDSPPPAPECLHTVRHIIRLPRVIILRFFDRLPIKEVKFNRQNIFERDKFHCQYCGNPFRQPQLNLDHVIPRHHGGRTSWENVVTSCRTCNSRKANRLPHEANMRLIRKPVRPPWRPFVSFIRTQKRHESWDYFLNVSHKG